MISENDVEKAVDYLRSNALEAAQARANVRYLDAFLKTQKASLKLASNASSNAAAEDEALASPQYRDALQGYKEAVEKDALHMFKREAAIAMIDAWRSQSANARGEGRVG